MDIVGQQVVNTLKNLRREIDANGISEAACEMWSHAISLQRRRKPATAKFSVFDPTLPSLLRRQAE